jgi:hypothetical protein
MRYGWVIALLVAIWTPCCGGGTVSHDGSDATGAVDDVEADRSVAAEEIDSPLADLAFLTDIEETYLPDVVVEDLAIDLPEGGEFGDSCEDDSDCLSGLCYPSVDGGFCGVTCSAGDCPTDWVCMLVPWWEDGLESICVPPEPHSLCQPCMASEECISSLSDTFGERCLKYGVLGNFCASSCATDDDCPGGYECEDWFDVEGEAFAGCKLKVGECGCSVWAVAKNEGTGSSTKCILGNDFGSCFGERHCTEDGLTECAGAFAAQEICDGIDNDCDGMVDEKLGGGECSVESDAGVCFGTLVCQEGVEICDATIPTDEVCDGIDNNCDGEVDEGFPDTNGNGIPDCAELDSDEDGLPDVTDNCPLVANPGQEDYEQDGVGDLCDDDDDNDGAPDAEDCEPMNDTVFPAKEEKCNGYDDNCDDEVDEGYPDSNGDGTADCMEDDSDGDAVFDYEDNCPDVANPGQQNSDDDELGDACDDDDDNDDTVDSEDCAPTDPEINPDALEVCDGIDNDCNDETDEGYPDSNSDGIADCMEPDSDEDGLFNYEDNCPDIANPLQEDFDNDEQGDVCDDDDDGDGTVDGEDCAPMDVTIPGEEICDQVDNDCDGLVDQNTDGNGCTIENELGTCLGVDHCIEGQLVCDAAVPAVEVCDGTDNDCNGDTDEGLGDTTCGLGECVHTVANCLNGDLAICDPLEGSLDEACDGLDNDCNGDTDEGLGDTTCGLGECAHTVANCVDGEVVICDPLEGSLDEVCDGLDNDCNGESDEALGDTTCGLGECTHSVANCVNGEVVVCDPLEGSLDEACDGLDNNCDGEIDEGFVDSDDDGEPDCLDLDDDNDGDPDLTDCAPLDPAVGSTQEEVCYNDLDDDCSVETPDVCVPVDCKSILADDPAALSGIHVIDPDGGGPVEPFETLCDMETGEGGWTLVARLSDDGALNWVRRYNSEMPETLWFNGQTAGVLEGTDDYKNAAFDQLVLNDLLLTVNVKETGALVYGVWADGIGDGEGPFASQSVWTTPVCTKYSPQAAIKSGEIGSKPGGGYIHGIMFGPHDNISKSTICVRNGHLPGLNDDLANGGSGYSPPETAVIGLGSDASKENTNPNPQGFGNYHNEGRYDFRALVQGKDIYNYGMLTTGNYGLVWVR